MKRVRVLVVAMEMMMTTMMMMRARGVFPKMRACLWLKYAAAFASASGDSSFG